MAKKTANVGRISVSMDANTAKYIQKVVAAQKRTKKEMTKMQKAFKAAQTASNSAFDKMKAGLGALAAAYGAVKMAQFILETKDAIIEQKRLADQLGVTRAEFQKLSFVGKSLGKSGEQVADVLKETTERIEDASREGGELRLFFKEMGIQWQEFEKLDPSAQFEKLAGALDQLDNGDSIYWADKMGDQFSELYLRLRNSNVELKDLYKTFDDLGGADLSAYDDSVIDLQTSIDKVNRLWETFKNNFVVVVANPMKDAIDALIMKIKEAGDGSIGLGMLRMVKSFTKTFLQAMNGILKGFEIAAELFARIYNALPDSVKGSVKQIGVSNKPNQEVLDQIQAIKDLAAAQQSIMDSNKPLFKQGSFAVNATPESQQAEKDYNRAKGQLREYQNQIEELQDEIYGVNFDWTISEDSMNKAMGAIDAKLAEFEEKVKTGTTVQTTVNTPTASTSGNAPTKPKPNGLNEAQQSNLLSDMEANGFTTMQYYTEQQKAEYDKRADLYKTALDNKKVTLDEYNLLMQTAQQEQFGFEKSLLDEMTKSGQSQMGFFTASQEAEMNKRLAVLKSSLENQLITEDEHNILRREALKSHYDQMAELTFYNKETNMSNMQDQFQLEMETLAQQYEQKLMSEDEFLAKVLQKKKDHEEKVAAMESGYHKKTEQERLKGTQSQLNMMGEALGGINSIMQAAGVENKKIQKAMFVANQAVAFATNIINTQLAMSMATATLPPPVGQAVAAQEMVMGIIRGATIAAQTVAGVAHGGMDSIPTESTFLLNKGERVVQPRANAKLTKFLEDNERGGGMGGNVTIDAPLIVHGNVTDQKWFKTQLYLHRQMISDNVSRANREKPARRRRM